ncbi:proline-rich protein PRCC [Battus philenor]|uniref:proline-rich protein PRCC n=1 Tax=Battus philenor TaxID=42288 RepID=UPI0035CFEBAB
MSLVAYDNSDSSEYEDDQENSIHKNTTISEKINERADSSISEPIVDTEIEAEVNGSLFNALPQPSNKVSRIIEEEDEFLHKKEASSNNIKPKSKISVPSLSDFKDIENTVPSAKPRSVNGKKSGLLSILPQPKNGSVSVSAKSLIPHVLTHKPVNANVKKKTPASTSVIKPKVEVNKLAKDYSDDSDEDDVQNDFFSFNKPVDIEESTLDVEEDAANVTKAPVEKAPRSLESYFKKDIESHSQSEPSITEEDAMETETASSSNNESIEIPDDNVVLDEEAILKLVGARGKRKREEIQIVNFNQQEVLAEARQLLLKGLMEDTSKRVSASKKRGNEPTHLQKRKHQITYLAHQAKANEVELQNKWANNRMSKRQTQSKYGF